ncbi:hypothetical protein EV363DRAFT_1262177 [Boletus edulis]|nr:hypothetical protein EV363DRAFT_1262177 [Boletus edulis]
MRGFFGDRGGVEKNFDLYARSEEICDLGQWNIVSNVCCTADEPRQRGSDDKEHTASGWSGSYDGPSRTYPWATCPRREYPKNFSKPACNQVVLLFYFFF